jgi:hypothetical protein
MKNYIASLLVAGLSALAIASASAAEKPKASAVTDYPFWSLKKRGLVPQFVPGLTAVLQLTEAQREKIAAAREEFSQDEAVKAARSISKSDPSVTAEQREKARAVLAAATARLHEKVVATLTPEQKGLIEKIDAAYAAAVEDTGIVYAEKFASVKADEAARRRIQEEKNQDIEEQFYHKLDGILTASQKDAMKLAADEEAQRNAKAAAVKKPVK